MHDNFATSKPYRPCKWPGCGALTRETWCDKHKPKDRGRRKESESWHSLYYTQAWKRLRAEQLISEPFCRRCACRGLRTPATEVDHITPHRGDRALFFDRGNLQSLCHSCHSAKTAREQPPGLKKFSAAPLQPRPGSRARNFPRWNFEKTEIFECFGRRR